jgi:6-phosphogluconolactonase
MVGRLDRLASRREAKGVGILAKFTARKCFLGVVGSVREFGQVMNRLSTLVLLCVSSFSIASAETLDIWIGTGNPNAAKGIYFARLDSETGKLNKAVTVAAEMEGPGFVAKHPTLDVLYAVGGVEGKPSVVAFKIVGSGRDKTLELLGSLEIGDAGPCHLAVDSTGNLLLTAQYAGGSVAAFRLGTDGTLKRRTALIKHDGGSNVVADRQKEAHAHFVGFSPDNQYAFVPDLGMDKVVIYKVDVEKATISKHGHADSVPGGGPRHMKFHTSGKYVYVVNELDLSVTVFDYDAAAGTMTAKQTIPTVEKAVLEKEQFKSASEIRVHPSGRFVYSANRGHDTITAFKVNPDDGTLSVIEVENARATTPRNFNLDPSGKWMITAGQDSHTLAVFRVDPETGELAYNQSTVQVPAPICVLFD